MAYKVKVRKQGGSVTVTLPAEVARRMQVSEGTTVYLVESAPGEFRLTPYDPAIEATLAAHDAVVAEYRDVFRKLAQ